MTQIKYKEDLQILKGLGCFLYDTPDMVRSRHLRKLWVSAHLHNTRLPLDSLHMSHYQPQGPRQKDSLPAATFKGKFTINQFE